jgi:hypothetical protein
LAEGAGGLLDLDEGGLAFEAHNFGDDEALSVVLDGGGALELAAPQLLLFVVAGGLAFSHCYN